MFTMLDLGHEAENRDMSGIEVEEHVTRKENIRLTEEVKAPGNDKITAEMVKNVEEKGKQMLV